MPRTLRILSALLFLLTAPLISRADKVDDYIQAEMDKQHIPGLSLAVVKEGKVIKVKGYGLANVETQTPATPETLYQLASVTKQFTASGIMLLVEEGKVELEAPISRYLPNAPSLWNKITVRHLLTHTSGLIPDEKLDQSKLWSEEEMFKAVVNEPLNFQPGEKYAYCNVGYALLGMIIQKVSGKSWDMFLKERVFAPLGMTATRKHSLIDIIPNRALGYQWANNTLQNVPSWARNLSSGGLVISAADLAKWDAALVTDQILKPSIKKQMWTPLRLNDGTTVAYGFGWSLGQIKGHRVVQHGGSRPGFSTHFLRFVDDNLSVIVLTNLNGANSGKIAQEVAFLHLSTAPQK